MQSPKVIILLQVIIPRLRLKPLYLIYIMTAETLIPNPQLLHPMQFPPAYVPLPKIKGREYMISYPLPPTDKTYITDTANYTLLIPKYINKHLMNKTCVTFLWVLIVLTNTPFPQHPPGNTH